QTGADFADWGYVDLYRAYDPARGNRVKIKVKRRGELLASAHLKPPLPVDNFEGVAFGTSPEGKKRIWLISDDNFNASQRTLLFAFDLD
ncbi:MAG: esterase-like activity of phytase family protein, partial [Pseudomonadota bacterium]